MVPQQQRRRRRRTALPRTPERRLIVARGAGGFGFTIAGQRPCVVSAVAPGGPAERAGLRAGDALLTVGGANVARASHTSVARLVAAAPGAIALSVAPRDSPPTDTEDTEPDERARTRRRHPAPRRRPQVMLHHPSCQASTSGVNEILQNLSRVQLTPSHAARLECRAIVGYLGTIETPEAAPSAAPGNVRTAVRKLRQERRTAIPILLSVLPNVLLLRRPNGQVLAQYHRDRIVYAGCGSDADRRYFGLVTSPEMPEAETSHSCHVFAVDPHMAEHEAHAARAREFQIACTRDPVAERCLEFPPSAEYVVGVIRGMYSLPSDDCGSVLQQISKLAIKGDSPGVGNFARCSRAVFRVPRDRRGCRNDDARLEGQEFVANSPQPSNHSEITTTSSNSDSGIGFHNDGRNIADRILVVDFARQQPPPLNRYRQDMPRRPMGVVGCSSFDADGSFLSNTTPVVDGFGGQGRPLNMDDVILNASDLQPVRRVSPRQEDDNYNYNVYGNLPSTSRTYNGAVYDQVYTESEGHHYECLPPQMMNEIDLEIDRVTETFNSVEMYEERTQQPVKWQSTESVENVTVISGGTSKASMDSVSVYSSRSHEEARPPLRKHLQASLDDMLVLGLRDKPPAKPKDDDNFIHPSTIKYKVRKSMKPLSVLSKTRSIWSGKDKQGKDSKEERRRAISASAGDVAEAAAADLPTTASEPDLRDSQSDQSSPFRRWTTGSGASSSYRHTDHRALFNKQQMSEGSSAEPSSSSGQWPNGGVARWSLGLEQLLADPIGAAAFAAFLDKEFAHENITFWYSCQKYSTLQEPEQRTKLAKEIWDRHLAEGAPEPVNIDAAARRAAMSRLSIDPPPTDLFQTGYPLEPIVLINCTCGCTDSGTGAQEQAQRQVFNVMKFDSYPRFLKSSVHAECARADLRGLPPPYGLPVDDSRPGSPSPSSASTSSKLKKSISNASERRRSGGGASLLPLWRLRGGSRDRAPAAPPADANIQTTKPPDNQRITDVVKCGSLCRVVLPDGATSVVGVEPAVSVRRLVERLLQRRNLYVLNYDVVLRDQHAANGESSVVDVNASSCVLGGLEVSVERRCVVRVEVGGRCVAVRCRPARRLAHVLRPVLARYSAHTPRHHVRAVLKDGVVVHPDTPMQELDGARLEVVEAGAVSASAGALGTNAGALGVNVGAMSASAGAIGAGSVAPGAVDEADSLSDLALRVHDDATNDEQWPGVRAEENSGRVRAALRPGPPIHHHPPDFLENLRETQRQRLQQGPGGGGEPRTPPPLPPKPPARAPALV